MTHTFTFSSYSYMIDNIVLLITGTLHQRSISELIPKCHPLGSFEQMEAIHIASNAAELYNAVLVDTPLGNLTFLCEDGRCGIRLSNLFWIFFSTLLHWLHIWTRPWWNEYWNHKKHSLQSEFSWPSLFKHIFMCYMIKLKATWISCLRYLWFINNFWCTCKNAYLPA